MAYYIKDGFEINNDELVRYEGNAENIVIPDGITVISEYVFIKNTSIKSVIIHDGVTRIYAAVFGYCSSLESITIPSSITFISRSVFEGCTSLASIEFGGTVAQWTFELAGFSVIDDSVVVHCTDGYAERINKNITRLDIPQGVTTIGEEAFKGCSKLLAIDIPEGITKIGANAFKGCTSVKLISLPDNLSEIDPNAFKDCGAVEEIKSKSKIFPASANNDKLYHKTAKSKQTILTINAARENAKKAKIEKVTEVSANAIATKICREYKKAGAIVGRISNKVYISIQSIDNGGIDLLLADSEMKKWMNELPGLLKLAASGTTESQLRKYASEHNLVDASRSFLHINKSGHLEKCKMQAIHVVIPEGVTQINSYAFVSSKSISSVVIPEGVAKICYSAFYGCSSLKSISISKSVKIIDTVAINNCPLLEHIHFCGTREQWNAIKKGDNWNNGILAKIIHCSDGAAQQ